VHCVGKEDFNEELLCCIKPGRTAGSEIFRLLDKYFSEKKIVRGNCVGVCADEAANMIGYPPTVYFQK